MGRPQGLSLFRHNGSKFKCALRFVNVSIGYKQSPQGRRQHTRKTNRVITFRRRAKRSQNSLSRRVCVPDLLHLQHHSGAGASGPLRADIPMESSRDTPFHCRE
jgi:hypothetical protein